MRKSVTNSVIITALILSALMAVPAGAVDTDAGADKPSDLSNMVTSLSNILSSTNPKTSKYANLSPRAGDDGQSDAAQQAVANLPPLVTTQHVGDSVAVTHIEQPDEIAQPQVDVQRLSPQTRRLLESTPSDINAPPARSGKVTVERGDFDPEYGKLLNGPIDNFDNPGSAVKQSNAAQAQNPGGKAPVPQIPAVLKKPKFDITIEANKVNTNNAIIDSLDQALRALTSGEYESAIALYKIVLDKDSHSRDAMFGLAVSYQKAGQKPQARQAYAKLLSAYPAYQPGLNNLLVLASDEAPEDALKELNELGARNPDFAPIYAQKGAIYMRTGDNENAKKNLIKAADLAPDNIVYRYDLAILLDKMGDAVNASKLYVELLEANERGTRLPVARSQIEERLAYIGSQHSARAL